MDSELAPDSMNLLPDTESNRNKRFMKLNLGFEYSSPTTNTRKVSGLDFASNNKDFNRIIVLVLRMI
jgi:hypothetical protein